ncbi:MAG: HD domain-containing protein [Devosia sp.]|uniref:HD-GYP domain-containing protein n=1 Tax=Devosia sp. TaxID=1871048 RepID=UPI001ACDA91F|nr:HD domain-containing phosphohydrolase [Devosia sp.]MBN9315629.1 HD domain-containing protein [Devosia sp.]
MAGALGARVLVVGTFSPEELPDAGEVIVDVDLRDMRSIDLVKHALDYVPGGRARTFLIDDGSSERLLRVQANALGATRHLLRKHALAQLLRECSVVERHKRSAREIAQLAAAPGGISSARAEDSLAELFHGLLSNQPMSLRGVSAAAAGVLASVGEVGPAQWLETVRAHHEGTFQHCLLVTGVAAGFVRGARLGATQAGALMNAALLHDIGKAVIPKYILDKPGKLTPEEFGVIRQHPVAGHDYLKRHGSVLPGILDAVRHHHEALDGSGYPDGLKGEAIAPLTRILTVCDVFAALVETRPYKTTRTPTEAVEVLIDMTLTSKIDYAPVRMLASSFGVVLPATVGGLVQQVAGVRARG